jgi:hypothetical protein
MPTIQQGVNDSLCVNGGGVKGCNRHRSTGPGYVEEFWILDVEGTRLMIAGEQSPGSPAQDLAERDSILDSIRIEP